MTFDAAALRRAGSVCVDFLSAHTDRDWAAQAGTLEMTVAEVVAHIADTLTWYPYDLAAGPSELSVMELRHRPDAGTEQLTRAVSTAVTVLAAVVDSAAPDTRGWHPHGLPDAGGFAAMACDELLVHTADVAAGLGVDFRPPADLAEAVLRRLFPEVEIGTGDPWQHLLWANGRVDLPDRVRQRGWRWHAAPLDHRG